MNSRFLRSNCRHNHDDFCFVCGQYLFGKKTNNIFGPSFKEAYKRIFLRNVTDRNVQWSPNFCCNSCHRRLFDKNRQIQYFTPMVWNRPVAHPRDCYFCQTVIPKGSNKTKKTIIYPNHTSAVKPVPLSLETENAAASTSAGNEESEENLFDLPIGDVHDEDLPDELEKCEIASHSSHSSDDEYIPKQRSKRKHIIKIEQEDMDDIVRDADCSKIGAEILASRIKDICDVASKCNFAKCNFVTFLVVTFLFLIHEYYISFYLSQFYIVHQYFLNGYLLTKQIRPSKIH